MRSIIFFLFIALVVSCGPAAKQKRSERRLAKLIEKNPGLVATDTIHKEIEVQPDTIQETFQGEIGPDLWPVDSLAGYFEGKVQPDVLDSLNQGFKGILERSGDIDTTFKSERSTVRLRKAGKKVQIDIESIPEPVKAKVPVIIKKIQPPPALNWYEKIFLWMGKTVGLIGFGFLFLLILYITYRIIRNLSK
jgi:hypothetical protein